MMLEQVSIGIFNMWLLKFGDIANPDVVLENEWFNNPISIF